MMATDSNTVRALRGAGRLGQLPDHVALKLERLDDRARILMAAARDLREKHHRMSEALHRAEEHEASLRRSAESGTPTGSTVERDHKGAVVLHMSFAVPAHVTERTARLRADVPALNEKAEETYQLAGEAGVLARACRRYLGLTDEPEY